MLLYEAALFTRQKALTQTPSILDLTWPLNIKRLCGISRPSGRWQGKESNQGRRVLSVERFYPGSRYESYDFNSK